MKGSRLIVFAAALALGSGIETAHGAPLGTEFTYQGQLKEAGLPADGDYDFIFRLYDDTSTQIGSDFPVHDWPVSDGLFTVEVDFGAGVFTSDARWLEVSVRPGDSGGSYTTLSPRQPVTAAPVALYALDGPGSGGYWTLSGDDIYNNNAGHVGIGLTNPGHPLHVEAYWSRVIYAKNTASSGGTGVWGEAEGTGVSGYSTGDGTGVFGSSQDGYGIAGYADGGYGVRGEASDTSGLNIGVFGKTNSPDGWGGYFIGRGYFSGDVGIGTGGGDLTATLEVENADGQPTISAHRTATTGTSPAIYAECDSSDGFATAIEAHITSTSTGMWSAAVRGINNDTGAYGYGVYGSHDGSGRGVSGYSPSGNGVRGNSVDGVGVYGGAPTGYGVQGSSTDGRGVYGNSTNGVGVYGTSANYYSGFFWGVDNDGFMAALGIRSGSQVMLIDGNEIDAREGPLYLNNNSRFAVVVPVLEITGADLAEKFPVSEEVKPGMVMAIDPDHPGQLCLAREAYNRRVAGVVSGANDLPAGAVLGHLPGNEDAPAVALSGRVWVYCDATEQPIEPGDLLTTSAMPGHAMKVIDYPRAQGAIIGKAMTGLAQGETGLVLILVNLQ